MGGATVRGLHDALRNATADLGNAVADTLRELPGYTLAPTPYTLLFVGDIMLSRAVGRIMEKQDDYLFSFRHIADEIKSADIAFGNLENPISGRGKNQGSIYSFRADPRTVEGLEFAGFDVLSLANNHMWDWGADALQDTVTLLTTNNIQSVGAGIDYAHANNPVFLQADNTRVAFLAYTNLLPKSLNATLESPGLSDFNLEKIKQTIAQIRAQADIIVISLHWGEEYETSANDEQKEIAHALIDAGADIIAGHHSHVVQELEHYRGGVIAYSLGNFVFDQYFRKDTMQGAMLKVIVENKKVTAAELVPVILNQSFQPGIPAS